MSVSLEERLRGVDVKPGQPQRALVDGQLLEVRVVEDLVADAPGDLDFEIRRPEWTGRSISRLAPPPPSDFPEPLGDDE
ncbi:MAG: hypothetical protein K2W96_06110 [Gemmataceae bacterium]|nr:hypothetical protein [Gemmataceae bacterium]